MSNRPRLVLLDNISGSGAPVPSDPSNPERENEMSANNFVTQNDLKSLEDKYDLKLENVKTELKAEITNLNTKIDAKFDAINGKFELIDGKFTLLDEKIQKMFLQQKLDISKERKENIKWIVGTGIAIVGAVAAVVVIWM